MKKLVYMISLALLMSACGKDHWGRGDSDATGKLVLAGVSSTGTYGTRGETDGVDIDEFAVAIKNARGETVESWARYGDVPAEIELYVGEYTVEAGTANPQAAAFDQPAFRGSQSFTIIEGETVNTAVTCTISNVKVTVLLDETFTREFYDERISVHLKSDADKHLVFAHNVSGYFSAEALKVQLEAKQVIDDLEVTQSYTIDDVAPADHLILTFKAQEKGSTGIEIILDGTLNDKPHVIYVPNYEEPGDPDDPIGPGEQTQADVTGPGIESPLVLNNTQAQSQQVQMTVTAPAGIDELWVEIDSDSPEIMASLPILGLVTKFDLANLDQYESGGQNKVKSALELLGLIQPGDQIKGEAEYIVDITPFMGLLPGGTAAGAMLEHRFHVTVKETGFEDTVQKTLTVQRVNED